MAVASLMLPYFTYHHTPHTHIDPFPGKGNFLLCIPAYNHTETTSRGRLTLQDITWPLACLILKNGCPSHWYQLLDCLLHHCIEREGKTFANEACCSHHPAQETAPLWSWLSPRPTQRFGSHLPGTHAPPPHTPTGETQLGPSLGSADTCMCTSLTRKFPVTPGWSL